MTDYRVTVDGLEQWEGALWYWRRYAVYPNYLVETHRPQTLRARFWRWLLGD